MSDLVNIEFPKARKTYTCDLCDGEITPGTKYMAQALPSDLLEHSENVLRAE